MTLGNQVRLGMCGQHCPPSLNSTPTLVPALRRKVRLISVVRTLTPRTRPLAVAQTDRARLEHSTRVPESQWIRSLINVPLCPTSSLGTSSGHDEGMRMRTKAKRRAGVALSLTIAIAAVALGLIRPQFGNADDSTVATTTVATGDLSVTVTGSGTVVDRYTYSVGPGASALVEQAGVAAGNAVNAVGYTTVRLEVSSGEHVSVGDHLAVVKDPAGETGAVKAPVAGYVRSLTTSKAASAGQVATIGGGGQLASVAVSEYDIASIKVGQMVSVTLSSLDRTMNGKVESIGQTAEDSSGVQQYRVLVSVPDLPDKARIGMSVTAEIATASKRGVSPDPGDRDHRNRRPIDR